MRGLFYYSLMNYYTILESDTKAKIEVLWYTKKYFCTIRIMVFIMSIVLTVINRILGYIQHHLS